MARINIPKDVEKELESASRKLGVSKEDILLNALLYYLQILERRLELKKELEIWERTSEIDLIKFEQNI